MAQSKTPKTENVAAVLKVVAVLETLADEKWVSLADISQKAMTSKSTAYRLLQTLVDLGYVQQDEETEKYGLTLKLFSLGTRTLSEKEDLLNAADYVMAKLSRLTGESINLGIIDTHELCVTYIHKYDSVYSLSTNSTLGMRNPLHSTSLGKALLAWRDDKEIMDYLAEMPMEKLAPNTITDKLEFMEQLKQIRTSGFAEEVEESETGVRCIAAPIFNQLGKSIAAISISYPIFRFKEENKDKVIQELKSLCLEVSHQLGYWK